MKALVLSSGGVDSTTLLGLVRQKRNADQVISLSMFYGQKHTKEIESARNVAKYYKVEHIELDLTPIFQFSDCSLLSHSDQEIPKESYANQIQKAGGYPVSTYVPFRNGLFISCAASIAISKNCSIIYYGAHHDDAAGDAYPDCSKTFNDAMDDAIYHGSGKQCHSCAPFLDMTKSEIVKEGLNINVPYELTWSCYEGGQFHCGKCGTCIDRQNAFNSNGAVDPVPYLY